MSDPTGRAHAPRRAAARKNTTDPRTPQRPAVSLLAPVVLISVYGLLVMADALAEIRQALDPIELEWTSEHERIEPPSHT